MDAWTPDRLDGLPRLGWVTAPSPVDAAPALAARLGLGGLWVKRDDLLPALHGGTKVRKLDYLLAQPEVLSAPAWTSVGGIGSGHLATLAAAATLLDKRLDAWVFWEPTSPGVLENLAYLASSGARIHDGGSRIRLALRRPRLLLGGTIDGARVIPPGATSAAGTLGLVRAALEVCAQVHDGLLPPPEVVYLPRGTAGSAAGLALGFSLGGLQTTIRAISAIEPRFARLSTPGGWIVRASALLNAAGLSLPADLSPAPIDTDFRFVGARYGDPTPAALEACEVARDEAGLPLEAVYSGKAWAAMCADAPALAGRRVLFWLTPHRPGLPHDADWARHLPPALARRLAGEHPPRLSRRRLLLGTAAATAAVGVAVRLGGYGRLPGWQGRVLSRWEAEVVAAAADALLPDVPGGPLHGPSPAEVAANVDRYLTGMPVAMLREVHAMFALVEHGTALGGRVRRMSRLPPDARLTFLRGLAALPAPAGAAWRGVRDLCLLAFYQDPRTWEALGYGGPWVPRAGTGDGRYLDLIAAADALPDGVVR